MFPVYVVLTQCDSIAGFAETFAAFDDEQASQPWGMTLSVAKTRESAPEAVFDAEWTTIVAALGDLRTHRVARLSDAYEVLGVATGAADAEVTKAFRRLMSQNHPDKLVAQGLPESMIAAAHERTQRILEAYELVKTHRGIK